MPDTKAVRAGMVFGNSAYAVPSTRALRRQRVEVRRPHLGIAVAAQGVRTEGVEHQDEDVHVEQGLDGFHLRWGTIRLYNWRAHSATARGTGSSHGYRQEAVRVQDLRRRRRCTKGHLCNPVPLEGDSACCDVCGKPSDSAEHVCEIKREELKFVCDKCGRVATTKALLCNPKKIPA